MNHEKKRNHQHAPGEPQRVRFEFNSPSASSVYLAGTFNEWREKAMPMVAVGGGRWVKDLVLAPGVYEYRLVVDGQWVTDPLARETVPNPFGGLNGVIRVGTSPLEEAARARC